jgi:pyruvate kinase
MRKTKLVITMGPALADDAKLREVLREADAVRLNASHGDPAARTGVLARVRAAAAALGREVPVFLDLQGPKWRVGALPEPVALAAGSEGCFVPPDSAEPGTGSWQVPLPHPELFLGAKEGQRWLLDDGVLEVEVLEARPALVRAKVRVGGELKARKGVHPIGLELALDPLTPKDLEDVKWGVANGVELFAQSFVRRRADVEQLQQRIREAGGGQPVIAKIEHPAALENLEEILQVSWGVMVARGDLGVELGVERVPSLQKKIIRAARKALKPVITATQMLESMIENPSPTRAEASDVANAIWDGTDAVMLSAESAAGAYPVEAVQWLARIAAEADAHVPGMAYRRDIGEMAKGRTDISVAFAACRAAEDLGARWIVAFTEGGGSARMVSRLAGQTPVLGATTDLPTARCMGLLRGVTALLIPRVQSTDDMVEAVRALLLSKHELRPGDHVVMTMGLPLWKSGSTNTMKVMTF